MSVCPPEAFFICALRSHPKQSAQKCSISEGDAPNYVSIPINEILWNTEMAQIWICLQISCEEVFECLNQLLSLKQLLHALVTDFQEHVCYELGLLLLSCSASTPWAV